MTLWMRISLLLLFPLLIAVPCMAQIGVQMGGGLSGFLDGESKDARFPYPIFSPRFGITYHKTFQHFTLQPEIAMLKKGASGSTRNTWNGDTWSDFRVSMWYIEPSILIAKPVMDSLDLIGGLSLGMFWDGSMTNKGIDPDEISRFNECANIGLQYRTPYQGLLVDIRYQIGLLGITLYDGNTFTNERTNMLSLTGIYLF